MKSETPQSMKRRKIAKLLMYMLADALLMNIGFLIAVLVSVADSSVPAGKTMLTFLWTAPILAMLTAVIFWCFGIYRIIWRFASLRDIYKPILAAFVTSFMLYGVHQALKAIGLNFQTFRVTAFVTGMLFGAGLVVLLRTLMRQRDRTAEQTKRKKDGKKEGRVLIVGGGSAGAMIIKDLAYNNQGSFKVCGVIDDDPEKKGQRVYGVKVIGGRSDIPAICREQQIDTILFCIPTVSAKDRVEILNICASTGAEVKVLPGVVQLMDGRIDGSLFRKVQIEDLLERDPRATEHPSP